jgi:hypothetical protein
MLPTSKNYAHGAAMIEDLLIEEYWKSLQYSISRARRNPRHRLNKAVVAVLVSISPATTPA